MLYKESQPTVGSLFRHFAASDAITGHENVCVYQRFQSILDALGATCSNLCSPLMLVV